MEAEPPESDHQTVVGHDSLDPESDEDSDSSVSHPSESASSQWYGDGAECGDAPLPPSLIREYRTRASNKSTFTPCEILRHNKISDCWIVAGKNVYDATTFLHSHPGGIKSILRYSGGRKDCTEDLLYHSNAARGTWERHKIGTVVKCRGEGGSKERGSMRWPKYFKTEENGMCAIS